MLLLANYIRIAHRVRCLYKAIDLLYSPYERHPHSSPVRARYEVSIVGSNSGVYSSSVTAVVYAMSCYTGSRYNGTRLYWQLFHNAKPGFWVTSWWRHQMETLSALLTICAGNSPVPGDFPAQRPVTRSFDIFFDLRLNKRLSKQSWDWWFETLSRPLWRHRNVNKTHIKIWGHSKGCES